jgi:hypothetical protein
MDVPAHPSDLGMTTWFTTATGDDLDDTLESATHQALTKFCERHLSDLTGTTIVLFPVQNEDNTGFSVSSGVDVRGDWCFTREDTHLDSTLFHQDMPLNSTSSIQVG